MGGDSQKEPVAIIGLGLRLPGAETLDGFWEHLAAERSLITEVPAERWDAKAVYGNPAKGNKTNSIWGGFVEDADCFDAEFFGISPREAAWMDPQQRFALEMSWQAIEDGGYRASDLAGSRTGVFMGVCHWDYAELLEKHLTVVDAYLPTGIAFSIIANRVSHFFDFHGPSITNDTACAASMTSIYEAVRALQDGTCDLALAGGVNLIWSPNHFVAFSKAGMLSKDGKSKAFDDAANGYVRGEGGAVLLLKPLSHALADADPIHGVIKGIGINHGGRTNSLTVTSPDAQAELIKQVHREAGVSPDTVDFVEAHGPGTPLGDPIEIAGLKAAFSELAAENKVSLTAGACGIGSVKTNIGHLEGAAGVAGVVKVLAALKQGRLPANSGFREENRLIDLGGSSFRIQKEQTEWPEGGDRPRRACVSSFGFGGSNGHVLLEEAPDQSVRQMRRSIAAVPLSATSTERLAEYAARLLGFVEEINPDTVTLADIARTYQMAREPMDVRCVFLVSDLTELACALREFLVLGADGQIVLPKDSSSKTSAKSSKIRRLANEWLQGQSVDWASARRIGKGRRTHAPSYPFDRKRHWMDLSLGAKSQQGPLHPLLHTNTSGFDRCSYETCLTGSEFVLEDHHVGGKQILPGVAALEMARGASDLAGVLNSGGCLIQDVIWRRPVQLENRQALTIETRLERQDQEKINFQIAAPGSAKNEANVTGTLCIRDFADQEVEDLEELKRRIADPVETDVCYDWLRQSGVDHGPAFRALSRVNRSGQEVLAQIKLPRRLMASLEAMPLHPVLLDAAIQAWVASGNAPPTGAGVPFSCQKIEVHGACEMVMWAHVRMRDGAQDAPVRQLDIDLLDRSGARKVKFKGLVLRVIDHDHLLEPVSGADEDLPLIVTDGGWQSLPLEVRGSDIGDRQLRLLLIGIDEVAAAELVNATGWSVERLPDVGGLEDAEAVQVLYAAGLSAVRHCLENRAEKLVDILVLAAEDVPAVVTAPLVGLLKTAMIESPRVRGRLVSIAGDISIGRLRAIAGAEHAASDELAEIRYDASGNRSAWLPVSNAVLGESEPFHANSKGVYWITGGLGGLGRIFADWLFSKGARKLLLTGRSDTPPGDAELWMSGLRKKGAQVHYWPCDISDLSDVERISIRADREIGPLKGIIQAAGVLNDGFIRLQDPKAAEDVFAPKVTGTVNIDKVTKDIDLDFFVLCSSIASVFGNAGQAAYGAANAFLDAFAERRANDVLAGGRKGKVVAIAWPLWADGGMSVDKATLGAVKKRLGLTPLPREAGLKALETILSGQGTPRCTVLHGDLERIDDVLAEFGQTPEDVDASIAKNARAPTIAEPVTDMEALKRKTIEFVRGILADVLEMDVSRIKANRKLEEYGLDSIAIVESTSRLEEAIGPLSKTLFFEFVDVDGVASHLIEEHAAALQQALGEETPARQSAAARSSVGDQIGSQPIPVKTDPAGPEPARAGSHDIAIVGLSLHVSKADDQDAFWKLLSEGIDGFEPVPKDRWNNGALHHAERDVLGKTVVKTGAFLKDIDKFDPRYFRISKAEAELMSPEVRLFLQASVEAFEDAGYSRETMARRYDGDVAVIVGSMTNEYDLYGFQNMLMRGSLASGSYTGTVPNMVSYFYGFTGPSYFLDTMCSASSTCVHEAVHMLRAGRCKMALAGGVSLLLHPQKLIATSQEHFTTKSADVIRGYGLGAEGTILGEGVGALVLKPLADAERDGDHVYGVVTGTGISNAGVRNGFTVPNPNQQAVAIERALEDAGIGPQTIGYIEGHGSGTALGDPIEVKALTHVFRKHTDAVQTCPIGTVKSNVAHLLGASGLAGLVKVLAQFRHGQLAPSLHAETLNPDIPFQTSPFFVQRALTPWRRLIDENGVELPRRAGVTSIGAGGMNSHIVLEEHRAAVRAADQGEPDLLVFSALAPERLKEVLKRFVAFLERTPDCRLSDVAYTLQTGKNELSCRMAVAATSISDARTLIESFLTSDTPVSGMMYVPNILETDPPDDLEDVATACAERHLQTVAKAWCHGAPMDWDLFNLGRDVRRISLPAYPFEKVRCWYQQDADAPSVVNPLGSRFKLHPFIGENQSDVTGLRYRTVLHLKELRDYVYLDAGRETVLPIAAAEIACSVAKISGVAEEPTLSNLEFLFTPVWPEVEELQIEVRPQSADGCIIEITVATVDGNRLKWAEASAARGGTTGDSRFDLEALKNASTRLLDVKDFYGRLKEQRLSFAPYLESVEGLWELSGGGALCRLKDEPLQQDFFKKNICCPAPALAAAFELLRIVVPAEAGSLLRGLGHVSLAAGEIAYILCRLGRTGLPNIHFLNAGGSVVGIISDIRLGARKQAAAGQTYVDVDAGPSETHADTLQRDLREKAAAILKFSAADIGARETFHDLGFDSISLARFANDISQAYGIEVSPAVFFECEHVEAITYHLIGRHDLKPPEMPEVADTLRVASSDGLEDGGMRERSARFSRWSGTPEEPAPENRIAIIGMAGRFPQSPDVETFFDHLLEGHDLTGDLPLGRYSQVYADRFAKAGFAKHGGFLKDIDRFDGAFFNVSPVEAERLDPQQRILLETSWRTLEDAGYKPQDLPRDTGVFIGITSLDYAELWRSEDLPSDGYVATGNSLAMAANRLSHQFDIHGPSQAIDTACSSSLVAMLRARDTLLSGKCSAAIVGGVNLCLALDGFEGPYQAGMLSPAGRCHTFGQAADGYARGEGVAALLLKRLADAERDGDRIHGVIAGGAENHGGRSGALTAPNAKAQARLIIEAMQDIDPKSVSHIEVHGTGTELGDPVEINGLRRAYSELLGAEPIAAPWIGLGTVKSAIGHLEAAAGIAGVIKVLMAMRRNELPPTLHSEPRSPHIDLEGSPFRILTRREPWKRGNDRHPRRAGVSSFGFGGANAHVVLESVDTEQRLTRSPLVAHRFDETRYWLPAARPAESDREKMLFSAKWTTAEATASTPFSGRHVVVGCGVHVPADRALTSHNLLLAGGTISDRYTDAAEQLLEILRQEMASGGKEDVLVQLAVPLEGENALFSGLTGMLQTAHEEDPRIRGQVVEVPVAGSSEQTLVWLKEAAGDLHSVRTRYVEGQRQAWCWQELAERTVETPWRTGGVYLITGGMGGLGRLLAGHIAVTVKNAVIVLTGSSPIDADRKKVLSGLREKGAVAAYRQVDVCDPKAARDLAAHIIEVHGKLNGVFHCAGVLHDGYIATKSSRHLKSVLSPKVQGALALADACSDTSLDAFVLFSSLAGPFGNAGQACYAAANGFLDVLATRSGNRITAVDWPLWADGGMSADDTVKDALYRRMGQRPLETQAGLAALEKAIVSDAAQVAVVGGNEARIRAFLAAGERATARDRSAPVHDDAGLANASGQFKDKVVRNLGALFAEISGLAASAINPQAPLEDYGIDSLMITRLNSRLDDVFEKLPKTLFFRYRTLHEVSTFLVETQPVACGVWTGETAGSEQPLSRRARVVPTSGIPSSSLADDEPIAIIGMSGTYPDAANLEEFWDNLLAGHDAVGAVPDDRWALEEVFDPDPDKAVAQGKSYCKWGAFLDGFADFDPLFFGLSPREAAGMDPQERLFLMTAWQAIEDGGYTRDRLKEIAGTEHGGARVGVFAGVTKTGFALYGPFRSEHGAMVRPSTSFASLANRVSHILDLSGPSLPVDTMCSSSLSAIHEACGQLRSGSCALALAGGVNLYLHPSNYAELSAARMLSPTGRCRSFGAGGDGFVPGEGAGCVLLKPLSRAITDGDRIHAVVRGSAVNHGGRTNGYTVPNPDAQRDVIDAALDRSGLKAGDISYIEAHGTGTELGDPIEIDGLTQAFAVVTEHAGSCALGSVKSSIGHLEAAAGIAGLTKVILQMKNRVLVPSLHAERINPNIALEETPFVIQREAATWSSRSPRRAGVSSFGAGGANAHVILEEWVDQNGPSSSGDVAETPQLILMSAQDPDRLKEYVKRLLGFLKNSPSPNRKSFSESVSPEEVQAELGRILAIDPAQIDPEEDFDALGLEASHIPALQNWCEKTFGRRPTPADLDMSRSINGLLELIASNSVDQGFPRTAPNLADIAYTLQIGREAMDCRLALVTASADELRNALDAWLKDEEPCVPHAQSIQNSKKGALGALAADQVIGDVVERAWETGHLETVARLWVEGVNVDWEHLQGHRSGLIVSLPTYPFAKNRYWLPGSVTGLDNAVSHTAPIEVADIRQSVEEKRGDVGLLQHQQHLEAAASRVLAAVLNEVRDDEVTLPFKKWLGAARSLIPNGPGECDEPQAWTAWEKARQAGKSRAQFELAETALRSLPDILTGRKKATDVLFPDGRQSLVEAVYKENQVAARFSQTVAETAGKIVAADKTPGRKFRILEIGAGTGGTSEPVFEALAPHRDRIAEYGYSDVSRAFLIHAERNYADRVAGLRPMLLNIEKPLSEQGIESGCYDIVIAANALHATADISSTLARVRETLRPGGLLLLNETSTPTVFTHVTFGLLDGWWRFVDGDRRIPGSPSLTSEGWREALEANSFEWVCCSSAQEQELGQQIIVAKADQRPLEVSGLALPSEAYGETDVTVRDCLLAALGETLNIVPAAIEIERSFADHGLDSILGAEFVHRLRTTFGIEIDQTVLFDFTNASRLLAHLLSGYPGISEQSEKSAFESRDTLAASAAQPSADPEITAAAPRETDESIAIVGASGRFAKSPTMDDLWDHLIAAEDLVEPVRRFDLSPFHRDAEAGNYGRHGSFLDRIDGFDPVFFGISGVEATYMDPQQRLFLEEAWKTLESAGHAGEDIIGRRCGVFVGCAHGDYQELFDEQPPGQAFWGNTTSLIPARISYWLDLKGPAVAIDTACSSSLVALHLACQSLRNGECDLALAGGVFVQCSPRFFRYANAARMLSSTGRCAAFGASADGIVPGEAVGAVLLRPLKDALKDGDTILGVVAASGTNQDGTTNGITAPSASSQERLIRQVYEENAIDPGTIDYVEAHGTGTVLGDPIEHAALTRAFGKNNRRKVYLGAVKSNIGHATTAAGIAGLAKVLLSLREQTIPPSIHFGTGNPAIDFPSSQFAVNTQPVAWPKGGGKKRRAAISSFGFSGTNAHAVIEDAPDRKEEPEPAGDLLFVLSARTQDQLKAQAENLVIHLEKPHELLAEDVSFTLMVGRRSMAHRLTLVASGLDDVCQALRTWLRGRADSGVESGECPVTVNGGPQLPARLTEAVGNTRGANLRALGRKFLAGASIDAGSVFQRPRLRVPLPTYPFADKSYWVAGKRAAADRNTPGDDPATRSAPSAKRGEPVRAAVSKPKIILAEPAAEVAVSRGSAVARSGKVVLAPLAATSETEVMAGEVLSDATTEGVHVLTLSGIWGPQQADLFAQALEKSGVDETIRAIVVVLAEYWGTSGEWPAKLVPAVLLECAVPVVVCAGGDTPDWASALLAAADFIVARRSIALGREERRGALRVDAGQEYDAALALAKDIAQGPRKSLVLLKQHMRRDLPQLLGDNTAALFPMNAVRAPEGRKPHPSSRSITLKTDVMRLELFEDGVALITMLERSGRNMFTPDFMDGLEEAFGTVALLPEAKVVVLTGHDTYFACGGTREGLDDLQQGGSRFTDRKIYSLPLECRLPVIAAMQGHAIGAGWSLGMYCDRTIMADEAIYQSNYLLLGFTPGAGATLIFPKRLGDELGREILFSARQYRGKDLSDRTERATSHPARDVLGFALDEAHALAREPVERLIAVKTGHAEGVRFALEKVLECELAMHEKTFIGNQDVKQRIAAKFSSETLGSKEREPERGPDLDRLALKADLIMSLANDLMIDASDIRPQDTFLELGLDSILAVTWIRNLNRQFDIALPATAVYAYPTVQALTGHVAEVIGAGNADEPREEAEAGQQPAAAASVEGTEEASAVDQDLRSDIIISLAQDLMIDPGEISDRSAFLDLGLDSILAVTWIRKLNEQYEINLPATAVYAHPTAGALVSHIAGLIPAAENPVREREEHHSEEPVEPPPGRSGPAPATLHAAKTGPVTGSGAIAIIGASGKFPKAESLETFWQNIASGRDCIDAVPSTRWDIDRYYDPDPQAPGKTYCKWMGSLEGIDCFDAEFFNVTPLEAVFTDPQQRLFLETAWHAIEDAAIDPAQLSGSRCGVYAASGPSGYQDLIEEENTYSLLGNSGSILAARISYLLDLRGASISVDTACSSSLVAIAQACESLLSGTSDLAIAGGACVLIGPKMFIDTAKVSMLSADGRCFSFDERANGFVPGEGVGVVMLKRLEEAQRDGDPIRAIVRGWGTNQDGRTNGITAPNPKAQTALVKSVYERFDIDPASIGLLECHGTGTPLGDPIEVEGLTDAFENVPAGYSCPVGSVKSNIGHLLASAGVAGTLKSMLALERRQIPPSINIDTPNPHIPFSNTPFSVSKSLEEWQQDKTGAPRRVAVSSFGFSGTNAHLVLEEHVARTKDFGGMKPRAFVLSAKDKDRLIDYAAEVERFVTARQNIDLDGLAATLQASRSGFCDRLAFVFNDRTDLLRKLAAAANGVPLEGMHFTSNGNTGSSGFEQDGEVRALGEKWLRSGDARQVDKALALWAGGVDLRWPKSETARINLPGYPFRKTAYWPKPEAANHESPAVSEPLTGGPSWFGEQAIASEVGQMTIRLSGAEPYLTTHTSGEQRLMTGLLLPEMSRSVLERLTGTRVNGLQHLLWGAPVAINGKPRELNISVMSDAEGLLFRVEADGEYGHPCHLGSSVSGALAAPAGKTLAGNQPLPGTEITDAFRSFAEVCSIHSGPPSPEMARVDHVCRDDAVFWARLTRPSNDAAEAAGMVFDPFILDAVWRLLAFTVSDTSFEHDGPKALPFPMSVQAMYGFKPASDQITVKLSAASGSSNGVTVEAYNTDGNESLRLVGVKLTTLDKVQGFAIEENLPS